MPCYNCRGSLFAILLWFTSRDGVLWQSISSLACGIRTEMKAVEIKMMEESKRVDIEIHITTTVVVVVIMENQ